MQAPTNKPHLHVVKPPPTIRDLVATYIGAAEANPERAEEIFGAAAEKFDQLAQEQQNTQSAQRLQEVAAEFRAASEREATSDDFHELLKNTAQAFQEVGDRYDLHMVSRRGEIQEAREPNNHRVSIAPASFVRAIPGRSVTLKFAPSSDDIANGIVQTETLAFWQGEPWEAQAFTVDLGIVFAPQLDPTLPPSFVSSARPYAEITYGSDGNRTKIQCDVGYGVRMTGVGNFVSVLAGMDAPIPGTPGAPLTIGASIGMFAATSQAPVTRTIYIDAVGPAGPGSISALIPRPLKATQLLPILCDAGLGMATINFYGASGLNLPLYNVPYAFGVPPTSLPVPLSSDVAFIQLVNNTGQVANFRAIFQLSM